MRYLLLIPCALAMLGCLVFYFSLAFYKFRFWHGALVLLVAMSLQVTGIYIASRI